MTTPSRPRAFQKQAPDWTGCTPFSFAMGMDKSTIGRVAPSGKAVHRMTGDTSGGTTLNQCAAVARKLGVLTDVHVGGGVVSPYYTALQLQAGRGVVLQGNASALLHTGFRSTGGGVNHAVWINEVRGGKSGEPKEALVYDPAADGRVAGWGTADQGPSWWPWALVLKFAAALRPWGDGDPRLLGPGKFYVAVFPDSEPHAHFRFGGKRPKGEHWPDRTRFADNAGWVHSQPDSGEKTRIRRTKKDRLWEVWQVATGDSFQGSTDWGGNHPGTEWVARKRLAYWEGKT